MGETPKTYWRRHFGGVVASEPEAFAEALVRAADDERGHVGREELGVICRLVLKKLHPDCPCGHSDEPWHFPRGGVCTVGADMSAKGAR